MFKVGFEIGRTEKYGPLNWLITARVLTERYKAFYWSTFTTDLVLFIEFIVAAILKKEKALGTNLENSRTQSDSVSGSKSAEAFKCDNH